jgi:hypothetical protein
MLHITCLSIRSSLKSSFSFLEKPSIYNHSNKYFNLNINKPSDTELKGQGRKQSSPNFQQNTLESIIFPFPFEFTLQSNNFKYYDPRFTENPIIRNL